jgi:sulfur-carrier protein adenylyltransferase/sulfurtransferase
VSPEPNSAGPSEMTALELKERLDQGQPLVLVDVREAFERDLADLPECGQRHIPLVEFPYRTQELDRDQPTVIYCRTGNRSAWAAQFLKAQGFDAVWNLSGGVMGWREEVDPTLQAY